MSSTKNILACVTQQITCERLILSATEYKENFSGELYVIHVAKNEWNFLDNAKEGEALEYLFRISKSVGATLFVLKSDDIVESIVDFAKKNNIGCIVMGASPDVKKENNFFDTLRYLLPNVEICIIP